MTIEPRRWPLLTLWLRMDLRLQVRAGQTCWLPAGFCALFLCVWPLAMPIDAALLTQIAPGVLWLSILLSVMMLLDKLFTDDMQDHAIVHWLHAPFSMYWFIACRLLTVSSLYVALGISLLPLMSVLYQLSLATTLQLMLTLILGVPSIIAIGALIAAVLVGVGQRALLLPLLLLPLWLPIVIFATTSVYHLQLGLPTRGATAMLLALLILSVGLSPVGIRAALTLAME